MVDCRVRRRLLALSAGAALVLSTPAFSNEQRQAAFAATGGKSLPPVGWTQFCSDNPSDCRTGTMPAVNVVLDAALWRQMVKINGAVNRDIDPVTDEEQWGSVERWSYPTTGKGDCEDYVLEKRARLVKAGWPLQALLITVVRDKKGDGHAILTVRTDRGDFVLDNQNPKILTWTKTGYQYIKRQAQDDQNRWVSLGGVDTGLMTANQ